MCGIVGYVGRENCTDVLIDALSKLEYRGYDSAGIAVFENGKIRVEKAKGRLQNLDEKMNLEGRPFGNCGIGHTRWATHGEPSHINSHPHSGRRVTLVHNGIIENYMELKAFLEGKGYHFESQTDTETVAKLIDYYYQDDPLEALNKALPQVRGAYALAILFDGFPDRLYAVRKESPLIVGLGRGGENFVASDIPAILKYTNRYYLLEQDEVALVTAGQVVVTDLAGNPIEKQEQVADWDIDAAEKGGFAHFMLKEIHEQPKAFRNTISPRIRDGAIAFENGLDDVLRAAKRLHVVACGTAMHAGIVGKYLIESLARVPVDVDLASEFRYRNPILEKEDLVIIISQSGETADTLAALRLAKSQGIRTLAIVNVVGSSIAREADYVLYTWAGPEIAVASTKAYTVQLAVMYLLAFQLGRLRGQLDEAAYANYLTELMQTPEKIEKLLSQSDAIANLAVDYREAQNMFFIGRGLDYALSQEGSLKLKEISYIYSEAYAAGELKHGTISLIVEGIPVVALATQRDLLEKMISNVREVRARGAKVLLFCFEGTQVSADLADHVIYLPQGSDLFAPLLSIVPLQLFAYHIAEQRGCDVDKPRNLAKSVTVE